LLSWLSGVAMAEVIRQKGQINFPIPPSGYLNWITNGTGSGVAPRQGAIPNRFKALQAKVPVDFDGALVATCVREAWIKLAEHVWKSDQLDVVASTATRAIWDRQNSGFWEVSWITTHDDTDGSLMDQRKNWRSHYAQANEPGVKCMVMDGWQELSGSHRPGKEGEPFWSAVRKGKLTDIGEGEQLCALAYVKRRFARHFSSFAAELTSGLRVHGWTLDIGMPSVSYMAAVHWLEKLIQTASPEEVWLLLEAAREVNESRDEWDTHIACLRQAAGRWESDSDKRRLLSLDGNLFFDHVHANAQAYGYNAEKVRSLKIGLDQFKRSNPQFAAPLSPFYAVLLMDGDSLGSHMVDKTKQQSISKALEVFTNGVPSVVAAHNGYLIYAGGDDVLAILPLEDAMQCANAVRTLYLKSFCDSKIPTTISAAIEYAHVKMPLGKVLGDAHELLDDVAKDGAGRDALAVRVWKPGGMALQWAQPWEIALDQGELTIERLVRQFAGTSDETLDWAGSQFSNIFFFKIAERFDLLNPADNALTAVLTESEAVDLLAVDYVNSAANRKSVTLAQARQDIEPLLRQCRAVTRLPDETNPASWPVSSRLEVDGALLVRFLAQKGVEQ
jgi:CRISPR-associated protein Cmr2